MRARSPRLLWGHDNRAARDWPRAVCDETVTVCVGSVPVQRQGCARPARDALTRRARGYVVAIGAPPTPIRDAASRFVLRIRDGPPMCHGPSAGDGRAAGVVEHRARSARGRPAALASPPARDSAASTAQIAPLAAARNPSAARSRDDLTPSSGAWIGQHAERRGRRAAATHRGSRPRGSPRVACRGLVRLQPVPWRGVQPRTAPFPGRLSSETLEPLCRYVDFRRRLELAARELAAMLMQLPADRWRIEPYPMTGERRNTFVIIGETGSIRGQRYLRARALGRRDRGQQARPKDPAAASRIFGTGRSPRSATRSPRSGLGSGIGPTSTVTGSVPG